MHHTSASIKIAICFIVIYKSDQFDDDLVGGHSYGAWRMRMGFASTLAAKIFSPALTNPLGTAP